MTDVPRGYHQRLPARDDPDLHRPPPAPLAELRDQEGAPAHLNETLAKELKLEGRCVQYRLMCLETNKATLRNRAPPFTARLQADEARLLRTYELESTAGQDPSESHTAIRITT